jgi:hypothetical protein
MLKYVELSNIMLEKRHRVSPTVSGSVKALAVQPGTKDLFWVMHLQAHDLHKTSILALCLTIQPVFVSELPASELGMGFHFARLCWQVLLQYLEAPC